MARKAASAPDVLVLSAEDIWRALPMERAIAAMREALMSVSSEAALFPVRSRVDIEAHAGAALVMPAYVAGRERESLTVKLVSVYPNNGARNLPTIHALVVALDPATGAPAALLEGAALTAIRTAAASAAATEALARPDAARLAILGAGVQAHSHALAMCAVREIKRIAFYAPRAARVEVLIARLREEGALDVEMRVARSAKDAVGDADIVCTATTSSTPVFDTADITAGLHINAVGAYLPTMQEIPGACVARARVYVDHLASALEEAGDLVVPLGEGLIEASHVAGEIGAVLKGTLDGRTSDQDITLYKSVGNAAQDAVAAAAALEAAKQESLGQTILW